MRNDVGEVVRFTHQMRSRTKELLATATAVEKMAHQTFPAPNS